MQCTETLDLAGAYADGELDLAAGAQVARHLEQCPQCAALYAQTLRISRAAADPGLRYQASDALKRKVLAAASKETRTPDRNVWRIGPRWWAMAAGLALVIGAAFIVIESRRVLANDAIAGEVVSSHIRSLLANQVDLVQVPSSNRHTVKPWFAGKLDFSPQVPDLGAEGFDLVGGRLDYIGGRPVAALIYRRNAHIINVFVWPHTSGPPADGRARTLQGYNVASWTDGKMDAWAVSDLNGAELQELASLLQSAEKPATAPAMK
ncbi:MAG: putative transrane anti-sigma factor [Phycisphaerales bacterium]|jgi:anti-sigma factor RsiW|nr:putative transrane anti-sigma factor [Phycisphaerales bacterium]